MSTDSTSFTSRSLYISAARIVATQLAAGCAVQAVAIACHVDAPAGASAIAAVLGAAIHGWRAERRGPGSLDARGATNRLSWAAALVQAVIFAVAVSFVPTPDLDAGSRWAFVLGGGAGAVVMTYIVTRFGLYRGIVVAKQQRTRLASAR